MESTPFTSILKELVLTTPGANSAIFADFEGECVDLYASDAFARQIDIEFEFKIIAAHLSVFRFQISESCKSLQIPAPSEIHLRFEQRILLVHNLSDGYYLALILEPNSILGISRRSIAHAANQLANLL